MWSMGIILYEICALRVPFDGKLIYQMIEQIRKTVYDPLPEEYSEEISTLIRLLIQFKPQDRPSCDILLNLPAIKQVHTYLEEKYPEIFEVDKYDYNLSEASVLSEISWTSLDNKIVKVTRADSPRLLRPLSRQKPVVEIQP